MRRGVCSLVLLAGCAACPPSDSSTAPDALSITDASFVADAAVDVDASVTRDAGVVDGGDEPSWHTGTFRRLPAMTVDLPAFVDGLDHPNAGGYATLTSDRRTHFNAFLDVLFAVIDAQLIGPEAADWCGVRSQAALAGYELRRLHDSTTSRWLLYAEDTTTDGQAYAFINPFAKRDLVVEVPHEPYDSRTGIEGARLFLALSARVLVVNKDHRCSDPDATSCSGTTTVCNGQFRESDVAHATDNTFHLLHVWLSDHDPAARFIQLHGFTGTSDDIAEVSDSTRNDVDSTSVSVAFAAHLDSHVPAPDAVDSCQEYAGSPPASQCGSSNVQGRHTNNPSQDACLTSTSVASGRFLHLEQAMPLRNADDLDGWSWTQVRDALVDTWPECALNNGPTDCTLGSAQDVPAVATCP